MQQRIEIQSAALGEEGLLLFPEGKISFEGLRAKQQMLVDSDHLAFIYILETDEQFIYVSLPDSIWPELKNFLSGNQAAYLKAGEESIELDGMKEELNYLISNIEGNANYGEELVSKVEGIFLA